MLRARLAPATAADTGHYSAAPVDVIAALVGCDGVVAEQVRRPLPQVVELSLRFVVFSGLFLQVFVRE